MIESKTSEKHIMSTFADAVTRTLNVSKVASYPANHPLKRAQKQTRRLKSNSPLSTAVSVADARDSGLVVRVRRLRSVLAVSRSVRVRLSRRFLPGRVPWVAAISVTSAIKSRGSRQPV